MRKLELVSYRKSWEDDFNREAKKIQAVFAEELLDIHHIGSTAIPEMVAKPIIDILVEVQNVQHVDSYNTMMTKLGYTVKGENGIAGRRFFVKHINSSRTHHVHIYQSGKSEVSRHLAFRDYLVENPQEAAKYKRLKKELSVQQVFNVEEYQKMKSSLVNELAESAINWASQNKKVSVIGFIIREKDDGIHELLTLSFDSDKVSTLRIPGGGVEEKEDLIMALNREIHEETGLLNTKLVRKLGCVTYYKPFIKKMVERHDFLLYAPSNTEDFWAHKVTGEDKDDGMYFKYNWIQSVDFGKVDGELRTFLEPVSIPELFKS
ncbi:GrpB family protein [Salinicoccus sp. ID82-1]|uniref:GrpB family protein n=1 Tax=Salinicoccus sp. ID82-1 TaxID=2820269 RepID=UPI001F336F45|nr:GrpB family protein [Salinicoccus sp. ID82-1]MCG1008845.1 GrpB family protein [Salinicoccus sp. ID82-1]